ncbi:hypothetical protein J5N97_027040 [Dioscorea zingiberensis]|uniref:Uncharacterized protein n=1 Tax=Dioscorea zingiberensis TaxID=325984 RepID=A0A9D5C3B9_9LILI|nr:hypothetical protein J5N97_027040 [Dioscorea zingiberensis]
MVVLVMELRKSPEHGTNESMTCVWKIKATQEENDTSDKAGKANSWSGWGPRDTTSTWRENLSYARVVKEGGSNFINLALTMPHQPSKESSDEGEWTKVYFKRRCARTVPRALNGWSSDMNFNIVRCPSSRHQQGPFRYVLLLCLAEYTELHNEDDVYGEMAVAVILEAGYGEMTEVAILEEGSGSLQPFLNGLHEIMTEAMLEAGYGDSRLSTVKGKLHEMKAVILEEDSLN